MKKLMVLDGNNLLHRAFYALPIMEMPGGVYTNAVYGFMGMLIRLISDYQPEYLAVAFDLHGPTFRHEKYADYKAGRKPTPEELRPQFQLLKDLLEKIGVPMLGIEGYEADDILGTMAKKASAQGIQVYLVSGDRDVFQLIAPQVNVLYTNRGVTQVDLLDADALQEKYGYRPERVTDMKALMGDSSDNIPGIPGVGEKTAKNLVSHFATLEDILDRPEEILKGAMLKKVQEGKESALLSKELATICTNAPVSADPQALVMPDLHTEQTYRALDELDMKSLIGRLQKGKETAVSKEEEANEAIAFPEAEMLDTEKAIQAWIEQCNPEEPIALTLWPQVELATKGRLARISVRGDLLTPGMELDQVYAVLGKNLQRPVLYFDAKKSMTHMLSLLVTPPPVMHDGMVLAYLLYGEGDMTLPMVHERLFGSAKDGAEALWNIINALLPAIEKDGMGDLYTQIELPLISVLLRLEQEGFSVDAQELRALGVEFEQQMGDIRSEIYELAGEEFNILSPKQLGVILFEKLGLPPTKKTKTGYSTDVDVLEQLSHPIAAKVLEYRALSKLNGTYVDGLLAQIDSGGKIHTVLHQTGTTTGRISSAEPNLQNIPVRTEQGRVIRGVFIASSKDHVLVDADYSQIELRVLAHMSGDENMQEAFRLGQDIHRRTASEIFGVPMDQVTDSMRSSAKAVNFGVVYGISDFGLARNTGISMGEARDFIAMYFDRYPGVKRFMDACITQGKSEGFVTTMMGRRRYLPELSSSNYNRRSFGERAAMNTPIQGTAADIIKLAMVRVDEALRKEGLSARLILQVHDELIVDAPKSEGEQVVTLLRREMEGAAKLSVPLEVDVGIGPNWKEAK